MRYIICHYHETGLKGYNRPVFEEQLRKNIISQLGGDRVRRVDRIPGRLVIELTEKGTKEREAAAERLQWVFGIANFAFAERVTADIETIERAVVDMVEQEQPATFKIDARRAGKSFSLTSMQINERVGSAVQQHVSPRPQVNLNDPEMAVTVEVVQSNAYLYTEKKRGPGGLPVGTGGTAVALLSGGIDSPVASFLTAKRGVEVILLHCHAYPYTQKASIEKARQIAERFSAFQPRVKIQLVPFADIQRDIVLNTAPELRMILYRRAMARIAQAVAVQESADALVTGESIGQVASQTLTNIGVIENSVSLPVLRPLIGMDKEEIVRKAREIGTYDISIQEAEDCCTRFLPEHPETRADPAVVEQEEQKLDSERLIADAVANAEIIIYDAE